MSTTHPLGLVHFVHIGGERRGARAQSNAHAIVVEMRVAAARLVVPSKITRGVARKINLDGTRHKKN